MFRKGLTVKFNEELINDFCSITGDGNRIRDSDFMNAKGKHAIVPGMLVLAYALSTKKKNLKKSFNVITANFGRVVSEGDKVKFSFSQTIDDKTRISGYVNGEDVLCRKGETGEIPSLIYRVYGSSISKRFTSSERFYFGLENSKRLSKMLKVPQDLASLLYAIACSSGAALKSMNNSEDKELKELVENNFLPVYSSISILYNNIRLSEKGEIGISSKITHKKLKTYDINSMGYIGVNNVYSSTATVRLVSERLIIKLAKNL